MPTHLVRLLVAATLVVAGFFSAASPASARYIQIKGSYAVETKTYGVKSCVVVAFIRWSGYEYAKQASGIAEFNGKDSRSDSGNAPDYHDVVNHGGAVFTAPGGTHQVVWGTSWKNGSDDCSDMYAKYMEWGGNPRVELWVEDEPSASFTAKELSNEKGAFDFTSTSKSPLNRPLLNEWDLGDGTAKTGDTFIHRYAKPGAYLVKLTTTDTEADLTAAAKQTVYAAAPSLSASILWDEDIEVGGRLPLDEPIDITVRVRASEGVGDLSDLTFSGDDVLTVFGGSDLVELDADAAPAPFTLAPGERRDFKAKLTAHSQGELELSTSIEGKDAAGGYVSDSPSRYAKLGQDLEVKVTPVPGELDLEFDAQTGKPIAKQTSVTVDVKNILGETIENAKLDMLAVPKTQISRDPSTPKPLVWFKYTDAGGGTSIVQGGTAGGQIARDLPIGDLAAGESVQLKLTAFAQEKARVRVTGIVRGVVDDGDGPREAAGSHRADVRIGQPTLLRVLPDNAAVTQSKAGGLWPLSSKIENVSPSETVTVRVLTHKLGNTVGEPVDDSLSVTKNPLGTIVELGPGENLLLSGNFSSDPNGGTRSTVDLIIDGWVDDPDNGEERQLHPDEIAVLDQPNGDPATRRQVSIDTSVPTTSDWSAPSLAWYFTDGFARGFGKWVDSTIDTGKGLALGAQHAATWMFYLPSTVWKYMSPAERQQAMKEISEELTGAYAALKKVSLAQARAAVDQALQKKLVPMFEAYEHGDVDKIAGQAGELLGEAAPDLIIDAATSVIGAQRTVAKYGLGVLHKADEAQEAGKAGRLAAKGIKGFEPGDAVDFAQAKKYWGMDSILDEKLRNYLKDKDFVISMRERSPGSIKRLAEGALGKIEMVKSKNVSSLDVKYLGFAEEHLDFAMYKQMDKWSNVQAGVLAQNPGLGFFERRELLAKVKARWKQRADEFVKESKKMNAFVTTDTGEKFGKIPVPNKKWGLNPNGNVDPEIEFGDVWDKREFKLAEAGKSADVPGTKDGLPAFQPQIMGETASGKGYKPLTGDMDMIAIVDKNGKIPDEDTRFQIYRDLAEMGFQHPESLTWNDAAGRAKYLKDFDIASGDDGQALLAYMPGGETKAIKLDTRKWKTELDLSKGFDGFMQLQGMRMTVGEVIKGIAQTQIGDALPDPSTVPADEDGPQPYLGVPGEDGADYDSGDDSPLVRENSDGTMSQFDPDTGRWVPVPAPPKGTPVKTVPQTGITSPASPGDTSVKVIGQDKLGAASGRSLGRALGKSDWFKPGDAIVVNPGGKTEERATVQSASPLTVTAPLKFKHWEGEIVALVPKARPVPVMPTPPSNPGAQPGPGGGAPQADTKLVLPSAAKAPKLTGTVRVGKTVTCKNAAWQGSAPLAYTYAWETSAKTGKKAKWTAIRKQAKPTLKVPSNTAGRQLRCTVTAANGAGKAAKSSAPKKVAAAKRR